MFHIFCCLPVFLTCSHPCFYCDCYIKIDNFEIRTLSFHIICRLSFLNHCVWVYVSIWRPAILAKCLPVSISTIAFENQSIPELTAHPLARNTGKKGLGSACLHYYRTRVSDACHHTWVYMVHIVEPNSEQGLFQVSD